MALTESKIKDLESKKFDKLYEKEQSHWSKLASNAFLAARDHICSGHQPRPDDVLKMLLPMLEPDVLLRHHQENNHCQYKRWREMFAEYMIDNHFTKEAP